MINFESEGENPHIPDDEFKVELLELKKSMAINWNHYQRLLVEHPRALDAEFIRLYGPVLQRLKDRIVEMERLSNAILPIEEQAGIRQRILDIAHRLNNDILAAIYNFDPNYTSSISENSSGEGLKENKQKFQEALATKSALWHRAETLVEDLVKNKENYKNSEDWRRFERMGDQDRGLENLIASYFDVSDFDESLRQSTNNEVIRAMLTEVKEFNENIKRFIASLTQGLPPAERF